MALRGETNLFTPCQAIGLFCSKGFYFFLILNFLLLKFPQPSPIQLLMQKILMEILPVL